MTPVATERSSTVWIKWVGVLALFVVAIYLLFPAKNQAGSRVVGGHKIFLSVDDGKTYFAADADQLPPVVVDGKTANRAFVFQCSGQTWVGYLQRYTAKGKSNAIAARSSAGKGPPIYSAVPVGDGVEIKRPGDVEWVRQSQIAKAMSITDIRCKDDPSKPAEPLEPAS